MWLLVGLFSCVKSYIFARFIGILSQSLYDGDIPSKLGVSTPALL